MVKALMNMDPFVLIAGGDTQVRSVQQWLNQRYINRADFFIVPCDGYFSRDVQRALMFAIQYQIGMADGVANGFFGPGTQAGIKANNLTIGHTGTWVQLYTAALVFNRRKDATFTTTFTSDVASVTRAFQAFAKLPITNRGDFQTWASLLVSTGDPDRPGTASDCVTEITDARAKALVAAGYNIVGRYLSNVPNTSLNKKIQDGELEVIAANGMRVFPIYQTYGGSAGYFSEQQGIADAYAAIERARYYGFQPGTRIYFAVDFDALDYQITDNIIPHFQGIQRIISTHANEYAIGIYGPRNVCSRVSFLGLSSASFVCDMSTGFSGNLGFPLPEDWAFDQIATIGVGSGQGFIEIDKNISSGLDLGQNSFRPGQSGQLDVAFDRSQRNPLLNDVKEFWESQGIPEWGGDGIFDEDIWTAMFNSTTESVDKVLELDTEITRHARTLRLRKAMIQAVVLKEYREFNALDPVSDGEVRSHYRGLGGLLDDCSTGVAQIFARTSIAAHNYCVNSGIIDEPLRSDVWNEWQMLNGDDNYNIQMVPRVLIHAASMMGLERPSLSFSDRSTRLTLQRYNGHPPDAEPYGHQLLSLYNIFEKYNAPLRSL